MARSAAWARGAGCGRSSRLAPGGRPGVPSAAGQGGPGTVGAATGKEPAIATEDRLLVLGPAPSPDPDGTTYGTLIADVSLGYHVLAPAGTRASGPGPRLRVDDLVVDRDRPMFTYDGDDRVDDDGRGKPLLPLDLAALTAGLGRYTRRSDTDRLTAAHRYLRSLSDDMAGDLDDAVVVVRHV